MINYILISASTFVQGLDIQGGTAPPDLEDVQVSLVPKVLFDKAPLGHSFGDCLLQPAHSVCTGTLVKVRFVSGHPNNDLRLDDTFLAVEKYEANQWMTILTDDDWETEFEWIRTNVILGESQVEIRWFVPDNQESGTYRITHFGNYKGVFGIKAYTGTTNEFQVKSCPSPPKLSDEL